MSSLSGNPLTQYGSGAYGNPPIETLSLGYYLNLVTSEYRNSPKFLALLTAMLQKFDDISQCGVAMDQAFDIDNAVGPQLDLAGSIVGASRTVGFQPSGGVSPILDDATYRLLIKATAANNTWDGTIDGLQPLWATLFPGGRIIIADQQNMTAIIYIYGMFTSIEKDLITNGLIVPRPEGVLYNYTFSKAFGFDAVNSFIGGLDNGDWI